MRFLVIGAAGMLGTDLVGELESRGHSVSEPLESDMDITQLSHLQRLQRVNDSFDYVVNCAAYTAVDKAEQEFTLALNVNGKAAGSLAAVCVERGWRLIHISTDFVFDGQASRPYQETDLPNPQSAYGKTKLFGEQQVAAMAPDALILRTAWLYGAHGKSFPRTLIEAWKAGKDLKVVADQIGSPTCTLDLARVIADCAQAALPAGLYHAAGPEACSWHSLAVRAITAYRDIVLKGSQPVEVAPVGTADWPTPAKRPPYSVLDGAKLAAAGIAPMRSVDESLAEFVQRLG